MRQRIPADLYGGAPGKICEVKAVGAGMQVYPGAAVVVAVVAAKEKRGKEKEEMRVHLKVGEEKEG